MLRKDAILVKTKRLPKSHPASEGTKLFCSNIFNYPFVFLTTSKVRCEYIYI